MSIKNPGMSDWNGITLIESYSKDGIGTQQNPIRE